ncbi:MAG: hypothetical protein ACE5LL_07400 [Alphaproteobacteria bacterium]
MARTILLFLALTLVSCSESPNFIGQWKVVNDVDTLEFFKDGTVVIESPLAKISGSYEIIDDSTLKIELKGLFGFAGPMICKFNFRQNEVQFLAGGNCPYEGKFMRRLG